MHLVILITAPSQETAEKLARALVEERLAACVNILPGVRSIYRWKGAVESDAEVLCLVKTVADRFDALKARVLALHPYEVPEIIALPIERGHGAYLDWLAESVS